MGAKIEILEGYVIDLHSLRGFPLSDLRERGRSYPREAAASVPAVKSGYGLINDRGNIMLLDEDASPLILEKVLASRNERGIRLRVERTFNGDHMQTRLVEEVEQEELEESTPAHTTTGVTRPY